MTALAQERTVEAYPCGKRLDGKPRYGMTPEMAHVYHWLVKNRPHDRPFAISFRQLALLMASTSGNIHARVDILCKRGWLERDDAGYRFVQPVMDYKQK